MKTLRESGGGLVAIIFQRKQHRPYKSKKRFAYEDVGDHQMKKFLLKATLENNKIKISVENSVAHLNISTSPLLNITTSQLHHFSTSPLHHFSTSPLHHFSTSPLHHITTSPHLNLNARHGQFLLE